MVAEEVVVPGAEESRDPPSKVLRDEAHLHLLGGTSVAMIENSYGRFVSDHGLAPLLHAVGAAPSEETKTGNLRLSQAGHAKKAPCCLGDYEVIPGGIER